ncbi:MAG: SUMF1/EgtB/PvdO family nonheme iron enzyme [Verrucomicrobia bacterium]|nr:SUMF1/EgtB/PvdO family nonheme iron enzyme [Verrucomicrobiota bacterium]MCH8510757.1 formylglycine-generating enzyme family protein [Kiritimatiellia bacterium]
MMHHKFFLLFFLLAWVGLAPAQDPDNPKPTEEDLILPMPGGGAMVFRPVFLDVGDGPYATREFKMGDRAMGGYKEHPTAVLLGGSFVKENQGQPDWMYWIGKYEVTERQYNRIVNPEVEGSLEPKTQISWHEVQDFIHRYNLWLLETAPDRMPALDETPGFLRLPTEEEWEFAARGGNEVSMDIFDRKHPYGRNLNRHEWYSGPRSSHDRIKNIGLLRPNPLGIHDMLGNVSEMTSVSYRLEYLQGRPGGFASRGGNFRTPEAHLRSSFRTEHAFYLADGSPAAQAELGFRLVIAAPVFAGRETIQALEESWADYRRENPTPGTAAQSTAPAAERTLYSLDDARKTLERLEAGLQRATVDEDTLNALGLLRASFGDVQAMVLKAERDSAAAWARIASSNATFLRGEVRKIPASLRVIEITKQTGGAAELALYEQRHQNLLNNIQNTRNLYGLAIRELGKVAPERAREGFAAYERHLIELGLAEQIQVNNLVLKQYLEYVETRRLNLEAWETQLQGF